jgi:hypothetical protein
MSRFVFDEYTFDSETGEALFRYYFEGGLEFTERVQFSVKNEYNADVLDRVLFLAFTLIGTSYYKTFPTSDVLFAHHTLDDGQALFLNKVYQEGLSQFAFENKLMRTDLAVFTPNGLTGSAISYGGDGVVQLQSGGKDSLLTATLLSESDVVAAPLYISSGSTHPVVIDQLGKPVVVRRTIDHAGLLEAKNKGGLNGHVPVTYIVLGISLVQAVLDNKNIVVASIGHEGEEPHDWIGDLPVNHQWSKTWQAEQLFADYVSRYISPDIFVGSPLRQYSELKVAELFAEKVWEKFGHSFSSCNAANYGQGVNNTTLAWCGVCPKCANSYLLFAPFVEPVELQSLFGGKDLFADPILADTFKGLLGVEGVMKPFECIGEVAELRWAYHAACSRMFAELPFTVPSSSFDKERRYDMQPWAAGLVQ